MKSRWMVVLGLVAAVCGGGCSGEDDLCRGDLEGYQEGGLVATSVSFAVDCELNRTGMARFEACEEIWFEVEFIDGSRVEYEGLDEIDEMLWDLSIRGDHPGPWLTVGLSPEAELFSDAFPSTVSVSISEEDFDEGVWEIGDLRGELEDDHCVHEGSCVYLTVWSWGAEADTDTLHYQGVGAGGEVEILAASTEHEGRVAFRAMELPLGVPPGHFRGELLCVESGRVWFDRETEPESPI